MNTPSHSNKELAELVASRMLQVLIRAGLIAALAMLSFQVFAPFFALMIWALILAVTLYPLHQMLARRMRGKQGLAATLLVILGAIAIVTPTALLMNSLADSVRSFIGNVQDNTLAMNAPAEGVKEWPIVGERVYSVWSREHDDLPALVQSLQPKIGNLAQKALGLVAGIGGGILLFFASFIIAGIIVAYGESGARASPPYSSALPERREVRR